MDSIQISRHFSRAANTYPQHAKIQHEVATYLLSKLGTGFKKSLDIGCGPGVNFTKLLKHADSVIGADIAPGMIEVANALNIKNTQAVLGNAAALPFPDHSFDFIFSSMALQWCPLQKGLKEIIRLSSHNAQIGITLPCADTLPELKRIMTELSLGSRTNTYPSAHEIISQAKSILDSEHNNSFTFEEKTYIHPCTTPKYFLDEIRLAGAGALEKGTEPISIKDYRRLMQKLTTSAQAGELKHTYHVVFIYGLLP